MLKETFANKKVFITGHTGFKGAWLSLWLKMLGAEVIGFSLDVPTIPSLFQVLDLQNELTDLRGDIRDPHLLQKQILHFQPDFVLHLAAQAIVSKSYQEPAATFGSNVMGTVNLLDAVRQLENPCTVVVVTSDKCYENKEWEYGYRESDPLGGKDPYSASKAAAELVVKSWYHSFFKKSSYNHRVVSVRSGNVIGGGDWSTDRIVPDCIRAWQKDQSVVLRSPGAVRPWQHVLEPLAGYLMAAAVLHQNPNLNGQAYNFGPRPDQTCSVEQMVSSLSQYWPDLEGKLAFEKANSQPFSESQMLKLSWEKAFKDLAWKPQLDLNTTLKMTAEWYRAFASKENLRTLTEAHIESFHK